VMVDFVTSRRPRPARAALAVALLFGLALPAHAQDYVYSSPQYANAEAPGGGGSILNRYSGSHIQLFFSHSLFGDTPVDIDQIAFRDDAQVFQGQIGHPVYDFGTVTIKGATIATLQHTSAVFADNLANPTTLYNAPWAQEVGDTGPAEGPRNWDLVFIFTQPVLYDPTQGDLVIDFVSSSGPDGPILADIDWDNPTELSAAIYGADNTSTSGVQTWAAPVSRLSVSAPAPISGHGGSTDVVPEPASWALMLAGFGLTGAALRRRGAAVAKPI
jgi:hypothetical protein